MDVLIPVLGVPTPLSSDAIASSVSILRVNNTYRSIGICLGLNFT